jgi:hypothetical protein
MRTNAPIGCRFWLASALVVTSGALLMLALIAQHGTLALFAALMLIVGLVQVLLSHHL